MRDRVWMPSLPQAGEWQDRTIAEDLEKLLQPLCSNGCAPGKAFVADKALVNARSARNQKNQIPTFEKVYPSDIPNDRFMSVPCTVFTGFLGSGKTTVILCKTPVP